MNKKRHNEGMEQLADQVSRVLVRIPVMKVSQLVRLMNVPTEIIHRLFKKYDKRFIVSQFDSKLHHGALYGFNSPGKTYLIRLSTDWLREYSTQENIKHRYFGGNRKVSRMLALGEVMISLTKAGLWPKEWDIMLPQSQERDGWLQRGGVHAWLKPLNSAHKDIMGLYIFPKSEDKWRSKATIRGLMESVVQYTMVGRILVLVDSKHYGIALNNFQKLKGHAYRINLLPLEPFLENPQLYLKGIQMGNMESTRNVVAIKPPKRALSVPDNFKNNFSLLAELPNEMYELITFFTDGDMTHMNDWLDMRNEEEYIVGEANKVAHRAIYLPNEPMFQAIDKLLRKKRSMVLAHRYEEWFSL